MRRRRHWTLAISAATLCAACGAETRVSQDPRDVDDLAVIATGWTGELVATVAQSYAGWDVEIGDVDNDGQNEIVTTTTPDSQLYTFKRLDGQWWGRMLAHNLAQSEPGIAQSVRVADLNGDRRNEVIVGTGQEGEGQPYLHVLQIEQGMVLTHLTDRPGFNTSGWTHNLAVHDLDGDGQQEVVSSYCGEGEVIRYDVDPELTRIESRKIAHVSGSGEDAVIADVDNDGAVELIVSNSWREGEAQLEIYELDARGELVTPPRLVLDRILGQRVFYMAATVGDLDNDGNNELIVGAKREKADRRGTIVVFSVDEQLEQLQVLAADDADLDVTYFERVMIVADADNDGQNELLVSTLGNTTEPADGAPFVGYVWLFRLSQDGTTTRELLVDFDPAYAESSWLAVGDADNDGHNEIVLATGRGDRAEPGVAYVVLVQVND